MSLLLAEGFEHFHPSSSNISSSFGSKTIVANKVIAYGGDWHTIQSTLLRDPGPLIPYYGYYTNIMDVIPADITYGMVNDQIAAARKGGKAAICRCATSSRNIYAKWGTFSVEVKKSRTLFIGFALRLEHVRVDPVIGITFGRSSSRKTLQQNAKQMQMTPLCGCLWRERGGYADIEWQFENRDSVHDQIYHNRNISNNDWHYFQFATTIHGGSEENPQGWGEAGVSNVTKRRENMVTALPGSDEESFIDTICVRVAGAYNIVFDDIYVCNDEGDVNNGFLGNVFVRPMTPTHTGGLQESFSVNTEFRHDAVGVKYVGDEAELPDPLPTPEEDPFFTPWEDPTKKHLILPKENAKQNFRCSDVGFMGSNPKIYGVISEIIAEMPSHELARASLTPIKTIAGNSHLEFPVSSDMIDYTPRVHQLIMENPKANDDLVDNNDVHWSADAINSSEYGFKINPVEKQLPFEKDWNPHLLRYPVYHDQTLLEGLGLEDWPSRHWEEVMYEAFNLSSNAERDWACIAYDGFQAFDEIIRVRASYCTAWSNARMDASILMPEKFMKDSFSFSDHTRVDAVTMVEESFKTADTSYHEWVEELQSWFDPYDFTKEDWVITLSDNISLKTTDIFDNHFYTEDTFQTLDTDRTNHEFLAETFYPDDYSNQGIILYANDGFGLKEDHFDGNWVEQVEDFYDFSEPEVLTRHWRFEYFWMVCVNWWEVGKVEQPLELGEINPKTAKNENFTENYKDFFGYDGYYDEIKQKLKEQWLLAGGMPDLDFDNVRWAAFDRIIYDNHGNAVDMVDINGESIIQETV